MRAVLAEVGAERIPTVDVFNKIDLLGEGETERLSAAHPEAVLLSARLGPGRDHLLDVIAGRLAMDAQRMRLQLDGSNEADRKLLASLYRHARVVRVDRGRRGRAAFDRSRRAAPADQPLSTRQGAGMSQVTRRSIVLARRDAASAGCASRTRPAAVPGAPAFPDYPRLEIPANLRVAQDVRDRHELAWQRLQAGDLRNANREFNESLKRSATFYPAETGLGFVALAGRDFKQAASALLRGAGEERSIPARVARAGGRASRARATTPRRSPRSSGHSSSIRSARRCGTGSSCCSFKEVQALIGAGQRARQAGRLRRSRPAARTGADAVAVERDHPSRARRARDRARVARRRRGARTAGGSDRSRTTPSRMPRWARSSKRASSIATRPPRTAARSAIDPRAIWRERSTALREKANLSAIPPEFRDLPAAATVSRAQVAALIGTRLEVLVERAPKRVAAVATDVRTHWAAPWILPVTQAGIMEMLAEPHLPAGGDRSSRRSRQGRRAAARRAGRGASDRSGRWRASRPRFADLPPTNLFYNAAALAVASGAMDTLEGNRFQPTRPVTGAELVAAIERIEQLAGR